MKTYDFINKKEQWRNIVNLTKTVNGASGIYIASLSSPENSDHEFAVESYRHNRLGSVTLDSILLDQKAVSEFFETVTADDFFLSMLKRNSFSNELSLSTNHFETAEKISAQGVPSSLGFSFSALTDGNYEAFEALLNTNAAIQMDNETTNNSLEIFARIFSQKGLKVAEKVFTSLGGNIQDQNRFTQTILNLSSNAVKSLLEVPDESFVSALTILSISNLSEEESNIIAELINEFSKRDWVKIGELFTILSDSTSNLSEMLAEINKDHSRIESDILVEMMKMPLHTNQRTRALWIDHETNQNNVKKLIAVIIYKYTAQEITESYEKIVEYAEEHEKNLPISGFKPINHFSILQFGAILLQNDCDMEVSLSLSMAGFEINPSKWE